MDWLGWLAWSDGLGAGAVVAALALAFTIASFWWLNARRGKLQVARPGAYVFASRVRLRLPLAFYNTGAVALIVADLRLLVDNDDTREPMPWIAVLPNIRRSGAEGDVSEFATPFAVPGRGTHRVVAEFGDDRGWTPEPSSRHELRLQGRLHPRDEWRDLGLFDWWAPPDESKFGTFLTYRNAPIQDP